MADLSIELDDSLWLEVKKVCEELRISPSALVHEALLQYVNQAKSILMMTNDKVIDPLIDG